LAGGWNWVIGREWKNFEKYDRKILECLEETEIQTLETIPMRAQKEKKTVQKTSSSYRVHTYS
jgi:hypothetical protein